MDYEKGDLGEEYGAERKFLRFRCPEVDLEALSCSVLKEFPGTALSEVWLDSHGGMCFVHKLRNPGLVEESNAYRVFMPETISLREIIERAKTLFPQTALSDIKVRRRTIDWKKLIEFAVPKTTKLS